MDTRMKYRTQGGGPMMMLGQTHRHQNNNLLRSTGNPIYTLCGSHSKMVNGGGGGSGGGPQLLMNATNVNASTQFTFIPARTFVTSIHHPIASRPAAEEDISENGAFPFQPLLNTIRGFFTSFIRPRVTEIMESFQKDLTTPPPPPPFYADDDEYETKSDPPKTTDYDIDFNLFDAMELSASTKSFSDNDLRKCTQTTVVSDDDDDDEFADAIDMIEPAVEETQTKDSTTTTIIKPKQNLRSPNRHKKHLRRSKHHGTPQAVVVVVEKHLSSRLHFQPAKKSTGIKNRKENSRHQLAWDIHEDIILSGDSATETTEIADEDTVDFARFTECPSSSSSFAPTTFSASDFPAICKKPASPTKRLYAARKPRKTATPPPSPQPAAEEQRDDSMELRKNCSWEIPYRTTVSAQSLKIFNSAKQRAADRQAATAAARNKECDSEDNCSIEFVNVDVSGESDLVSTQSICERIRNHFDGIGGRGRRVRQMSECSDDFICFERDDDEAENDADDDEETDVDDDDDEDSENEEESDVDGEEGGISDDSDDDVDDDDIEDIEKLHETTQLDSGFEEKKVSSFYHFLCNNICTYIFILA